MNTTITIYNIIIRLIVSAFLGALIGYERERHGSSAGFRTHILVCLGSAMTSLMSLFVLQNYGYTDNVFRISAQVISGIGFLGAGMILRKGNGIITGLTTAAGLWLTAAVGIATGYGFFLGAAFATIICVITTAFFPLFEKKSNLYEFYCEIVSKESIQEYVDMIETKDLKPNVKIIEARSGKEGYIGISFTIKNKKAADETYEILKSSGKFELLTKTLTK